MNIYALSSGRGPSGIAIIRLSGKDTLKIAQLISKEKNIRCCKRTRIYTSLFSKTLKNEKNK